jgi:uncharacterized protein YecE (DUF72 family)
MSGGAQVRLGACSWTAKGWVGPVYSSSNTRTFLGEYAQRWDAVEVDATFYAIPPAATVDGWRERTPEGFVFAAKAPREITHDRVLYDCGGALKHYLGVMDRLGDKLGPILFQFPYFAKRTGVDLDEFVARLGPFLDLLPRDGHRFALEVRNKSWLTPPLLDLLREHGVSLALIDHPWMPRPADLPDVGILLTGPFAYIRWLGDRKGIERITKTWGETVLDRRSELLEWAPLIRSVLDRRTGVFGFVNNHYSGHAPADIALLREALGVRPREETGPCQTELL